MEKYCSARILTIAGNKASAQRRYFRRAAVSYYRLLLTCSGVKPNYCCLSFYTNFMSVCSAWDFAISFSDVTAEVVLAAFSVSERLRSRFHL